MQCPYIHASLEQVKRFCGERGAPVTLIPVDSLQRAKELPGVFNNWAASSGFSQNEFYSLTFVQSSAILRMR